VSIKRLLQSNKIAAVQLTKRLW